VIGDILTAAVLQAGGKACAEGSAGIPEDAFEKDVNF